MPLGPIFGGGDDTTGSITPRDGRFSNNMTDTDWTLARSALQTALAGTNAQNPANWVNPESGLKGTITPVGDVFPQADTTCRAFVATMVEGTDTHWYQGQACQRSETWQVASTNTWMPPKAP